MTLCKMEVCFYSAEAPVLMVPLILRVRSSIRQQNYLGKMGRLGKWLLGSKATCLDLVPMPLFFCVSVGCQGGMVGDESPLWREQCWPGWKALVAGHKDLGANECDHLGPYSVGSMGPCKPCLYIWD